jgi:hypothetical protein
MQKDEGVRFVRRGEVAEVPLAEGDPYVPGFPSVMVAPQGCLFRGGESLTPPSPRWGGERGERAQAGSGLCVGYLVDPTSKRMLLSRAKPCTSGKTFPLSA